MRFKRTPAVLAYNDVVECVRSYYEAFQEVPTVKEVAEATGQSAAAVGRYMLHMKEEGIIESLGRDGYVRAGVEEMHTRKIPVIGSISCGVRKLAIQEFTEFLGVPENRLGSGKYYFLIADGESMINAGIEPGDYVLIREQPDAEKGQIVVALVGEEATLKRFYPNPEEGYVDLVPENDEMEPQRVSLDEADALIIQGVAVWSIHVNELL